MAHSLSSVSCPNCSNFSFVSKYQLLSHYRFRPAIFLYYKNLLKCLDKQY